MSIPFALHHALKQRQHQLYVPPSPDDFLTDGMLFKSAGAGFWILLALTVLDVSWFVEWRSIAWSAFAGYLVAWFVADRDSRREKAREFDKFLRTLDGDDLELVARKLDQVAHGQLVWRVSKHLSERRRQISGGH